MLFRIKLEIDFFKDNKFKNWIAIQSWTKAYLLDFCQNI